MKHILIILLFSLVFFVVGVITLSDYGINEDSPGHFVRGQAYLQKLTTGDYFYDQPILESPLLFAPGQRISTYKLNTYEDSLAPIRPIASFEGKPTVQQVFANYQQETGRVSFYENNAWATAYAQGSDGGHPPVSDILAAASNRIFYGWLGILGDIESYHLYILFAATLGLFFIGYFALRTGGIEASICTLLTLGLYPFFFSEAHFNIKDIPELSFFAITIISCYFWVVGRKKLWFVILLLSSFLAIGTKLNSAFVPIILLPWILSLWKSETLKKWLRPSLLVYGLIFFVVSITLFIFFWPYLWSNTFEKLFTVFNFYSSVGSVDSSIEVPSRFLLPFGIDLSGVLLAVAQTPFVSLLFFVFGVYCLFYLSFRLKSHKAFVHNEQFLILLWLCIPLLRVLRPGAQVFGSIRQYAEFLPALALICGIGGAYLIGKARKHISFKKAISSVVIVAYGVFLVWNIIVYHPNENMFVNSLFGGPKGAQNMGLLDWQFSYDQPYRQAINWLNTHAEKNAKLAYLDGTMEAIPTIWLRPDIHFGSFFSGFDAKDEYIISIVYPNPPSVFPYGYLERFLTPVYSVSVQGEPVVKVWKNSPENVVDSFKTEKIVAIPQITKGRDSLAPYWEITFPESYQVISLTVKNNAKACLKRDGLFALAGYTVPMRKDLDTATTVFYFPGIDTTKIRFYSIVNTCFSNVTIEKITAL